MTLVSLTEDVGTGTAANQDKAALSRAEASRDAELVRRCQDGDERAFEEIVRRHRAKVFYLVLGALHNHADAEEVTSETFVRAHRGLGAFRGDASLATWLHYIALNLARNRYWYLFRRRRLEGASLDTPLGEDSSGTLADVVATDAPDPAQANDQREFAEVIHTCLGRLPPSQREILKLRGVLDRSYDEIAKTLGTNVGTVKSRVARARFMLRRVIDETYAEFASTPRSVD